MATCFVAIGCAAEDTADNAGALVPVTTIESGDDSSSGGAALEEDESSGDESSDETTVTGTDADSSCREHAACFSWCGARYRDGRCESAEDALLELDATLCEPLQLELVQGRVRLGAQMTNDDARCFLQVLRCGHAGVAELRWNDRSNDRAGRLFVIGDGDHYVGLDMKLDGVEPECGTAVALTAPRAHVRAERDLLFDECLDSGEDVDLEACVLGPAAIAFYSDYDWAFDVAFPWLTGSCGVT